MRKNCVVCGGEFEAYGQWKTCSAKCSQERRDTKDHRRYWADPEKGRKRTREYLTRNPVPKHIKSQRDRDHYRANSEHIRAKVKEYRLAKPDVVKERKRSYYFRTIDRQRDRHVRRNKRETAAMAILRGLLSSDIPRKPPKPDPRKNRPRYPGAAEATRRCREKRRAALAIINQLDPNLIGELTHD